MSKDEQHDHEMMVEAIHDKRHRDPLPDNPPPGPKWQAKKGLYRLGLNGAEYSVLGCLIDRASKAKGACWPSQEFIWGWTFRRTRTVERAISTLNDKGLIRIIDRGTTSNAYIINWPPLFAAHRQIEAFEKNNKSRYEIETFMAAQGASVPPEVAAHVPPEVAAKPLEGEPCKKRNPVHISAPSSDGAYVVVLSEIKKEEESIQWEQAGKPSTSPLTQPPAGPLSYEEAEDAVMAAMGHFEWSHHTSESYQSCIEAEMAAPGNGVAAVKAIANRAWRNKRSNAK